MVLRKPYAFLIKHFKLFHIALSALVIYSIMCISRVISFINWYLGSNIMLITLKQFREVYSVFDFIVPIIILGFSIILFLVMTLKKKPNKFYLFSMVMSFGLLAVNIYGYITLRELTEVWLTVNRLSILSDIYLFMMVGYVALCAMSLSRAIGFNISRFDFNNDISEFELSDEDNAEFEVSIDFDINDAKRNAKKQVRYIKYFLKENRTTLLGVGGLFLATIAIYSLTLFFHYRKDVVKGNELNYNGFSVVVNESYIIDSDSKGLEFDDNKHLLVVVVDITNNGYTNATPLSTGYYSVNIGSDSYVTTEKYETAIVDLGKLYTGESIKLGDTITRVLVFEIPENHMFSRILFGARDVSVGATHYVKLKPKNLSGAKEKIVEGFVGEEINFDDSAIKNSKIKIDSFEVKNRYKINYRFCTRKSRCVDSTEYLVPDNSLTNYDKTILKLSGTFEVNDRGLFKNFYTLFDTFGYIEYKIDGKTYRQTTGFREIKSSKIKSSDYYIEVYRDIEDAESICLGLKIRNIDYRYYLTQGGN